MDMKISTVNVFAYIHEGHVCIRMRNNLPPVVPNARVDVCSKAVHMKQMLLKGALVVPNQPEFLAGRQSSLKRPGGELPVNTPRSLVVMASPVLYGARLRFLHPGSEWDAQKRAFSSGSQKYQLGHGERDTAVQL